MSSKYAKFPWPRQQILYKYKNIKGQQKIIYYTI